MSSPKIPVQTIQYKTYLKTLLVDSIQSVFNAHPDTLIRDTKVRIDFSFEKADYPSVVIRFLESEVKNAGVGHREWIESPTVEGQYIKYKHAFYQGYIEFAIYALSSYDRDLISDTLVQLLHSGDIETYTNNFYNDIYQTDEDEYPNSIDHMININTDKIMGMGESQTMAPWQAEDTMVYQTSYRVEVHGEFYSRTIEAARIGTVEEVQSYPYNPSAGETKPNPNPEDPAPWSSPVQE